MTEKSKVTLSELVQAAKERQAELHAQRLAPGGLQDQLHALLEETMGAEGDTRVVAVRRAIAELQREKYEIDQGLSEATKAAGGATVLRAE